MKIEAVPGWQSRGEIVHGDDEQYLGTGGPDGYEEMQTHDTYSLYPRGVHMRLTFGGEINDIEPMYLITQFAAILIYVTASSIIVHTIITRFLGYRSRVFRESIGEVITVANVHSKKGAQAIIAATAFNKLRETTLKRAESAQTGGAYWRQTVLDELREAGMAEEEAKGIAQIVAPYGSIQFDKFVDRSATQSQLTSKTIAEMEMGWKAKEEGALPIPSLPKTM